MKNNMDNILKMNDFMGVQSKEHENILGKFLYFSLSSILIEKEKLSDICTSMGLSNTTGKRLSTIDAFKSATGDIYERIVKKTDDTVLINKVYCRDNQKNGNIYSRELLKETLGENSNRYFKLANLLYDKEYERFDYNVSSFSSDIDVLKYCEKAGELFELYKVCAGRNQIETLSNNLLQQMESLKIEVYGRLYFVPKKHMHMVDIFEDFLDAVGKNNLRKSEITVNSMYVADDEKQRGKMTTEFYNMAQKEIELYTEKIENLIATNSRTPAIMERWILKVEALEEKKKYYEELLRHELDNLGEGYTTLKFLSQELSVRANKLRQLQSA